MAEEEATLFECADLAVTQTRILVPGTVYAVNGVTSVSAFEEPDDPSLAWVMIVGGSFSAVLLWSTDWLELWVRWASVGVAVLGILLLLALGSTFHLAITTAAGQERVWTTENAEDAEMALEAINHAPVERV